MCVVYLCCALTHVCLVLFLFCLSICMCVCLQVEGPLRKCLRARCFRASLYCTSICVHSWCNWRASCASCVDSKPKKKKSEHGNANCPVFCRGGLETQELFPKAYFTHIHAYLPLFIRVMGSWCMNIRILTYFGSVTAEFVVFCHHFRLDKSTQTCHLLYCTWEPHFLRRIFEPIENLATLGTGKLQGLYGILPYHCTP